MVKTKMRIGIIGYGAMGHIVEEIAKSRGIDIATIISPHAEGATHKEITEEALNTVDVCIDFTKPEVVAKNIIKVIKLRKKLVVGTTGWYDKVDQIKKLVENNNGSLIYAPNFSLGTNIFYHIIQYAAKIINNFPEYDICSFEIHHNHKVDSPSGTAKRIGNILIENIDRKKKVVYDRLNRKIEPDEIHIGSLRCGSFPGTHIVDFDSNWDYIELKHTNRSRAGLASGALLAAEWIKDKKGFFTFEEMIKDQILHKK